MKPSIFFGRNLTVAVAAVLCSATVYAAISSANVDVQLHGVDSFGNPSTLLGQSANGKSYLDSATGIVVQTASGLVTNQFGSRRTFQNQGLTISGPDGIQYTATADVETVSRPNRSRFGWNNQIAVYETGTLSSPPDRPRR